MRRCRGRLGQCLHCFLWFLITASFDFGLVAKVFPLQRKWFLWSIGGTLLILGATWYQVQLDVRINEWFGEFYDTLQKALTEPNSVSEKELVNSRLESFKLIVLKDRFSISNAQLLATRLNDQGINFNDALDPLTWIFDLLRAAGSQALDWPQFGISCHVNVDHAQLKEQIFSEFLELSEAHYGRYFST